MKDILAFDPISGSNQQLPTNGIFEDKDVHRVFPYRFQNKQTEEFGKANTTLLIGITNKEFNKTLVNNLKSDLAGNPYFNLHTGSHLTSKIETNRYGKSYSLNMVNVETFEGYTSDYFTMRDSELQDDNTYLMDEAYMFCFTIDEPFNQDKFNRGHQHVYICDGYSSSLSDEDALGVIENKHSDDTLEDQFNIAMSFQNTYVFASGINHMKIAFTDADLTKLDDPDLVLKLEMNNYALPNSITAKRRRQSGIFKDIVDGIELKVTGDLSPLKVFPLETSEDLHIKTEWFDYHYISPLAFLYLLYPHNKDGTPVGHSGSLGTVEDAGALVNMFLVDDGKGTNTPMWIEHGREAFQAICDMIMMTTIIADGFSTLPVITATNSVNYGGVDGIQKLGYAQLSIGSLNKGASSAVSIVDKFYFNFITGQSITPDMPIWKVFHCAIALLGKYINSQAAIAQGMNEFGGLFSPWYLRLINGVDVESWSVANADSGYRFNGVYAEGNQDVNHIDFFKNPKWNGWYEDNSHSWAIWPGGRCEVKSKWFKVINPVNKSGSTPAVEFSIEKDPNKTDLSSLVIKKGESEVLFPQVADKAIPVDRSGMPGDISTNDSIDLGYICYTHIPKDATDPNKIFNEFYQKEIKYSHHTGTIPINIPEIPYYDGQKTSGTFPEDKDKIPYVTLYIANLYRVDVKDVSNVHISSYVYKDNAGSTKSVGKWWTLKRDYHYVPGVPGMPDYTWHSFRQLETGNSSSPSKQEYDPRFQAKDSLKYNLDPTFHTTPQHPTAFDSNKTWLRYYDLRTWMNQACHSLGGDDVEFTSEQLLLFAANYYGFKYTTDTNLIPYKIAKYNGSGNVPAYRNPGIQGHWTNVKNGWWGGHIQMDIIPRQYFFTGITAEVKGAIVDLNVENKLTHFTKQNWIDARTYDYRIPYSTMELAINPHKKLSGYLGIYELIIKGFFIDDVDLIILNTKTQVKTKITLQLSQDIDDTVTTHRFTII